MSKKFSELRMKIPKERQDKIAVKIRRILKSLKHDALAEEDLIREANARE